MSVNYMLIHQIYSLHQRVHYLITSAEKSRKNRTNGKVGIAVVDDNLFSFYKFINSNDPPSSCHHSTVTRTPLCT